MGSCERHSDKTYCPAGELENELSTLKAEVSRLTAERDEAREAFSDASKAVFTACNETQRLCDHESDWKEKVCPSCKLWNPSFVKSSPSEGGK